MLTVLRKMGNSTRMILPKPILKALGIETGTAMELVVEDGRVVAMPVRREVREGWDADAERIGAESLDADAEAWLLFGNASDAKLTW
jgi:antitoxin MazE